MSRSIVAILGIVLIGGVAVTGFQTALAEAGDDRFVTNESWTPDAGNVTSLDHSNQVGAYYGNETAVYDENESLMDRGTDYVWFESNGTVKAITGGALDGDSSATISYTYQQTTREQRALSNLLAHIPTVMAILLPLLGIALLLLFINK